MPKRKEQVPLKYAVITGSLLILVFMGFVIGLDTSGGYWETVTSNETFYHNGEYYSEIDKPYKTVTWGAKQIIYDVDPSLDGENYPVESLDTLVGIGQLPAKQVYDPDIWGSADIDIQIGSPRHVIRDTLSGEWKVVADDIPYRSYVKPISDTTVQRYDHHVYLVEISYMTDADYKDLGLGVGWQGEFHGSYGVEATVLSRFTFSINSWKIADTFDIDDSEYITKNDGWAGIMSAFVDSAYVGVIGGYTDYTENPHVKALNNPGAALNMYVNGVEEAAEDVNNPTAIIGVPQTVEIETGAVLEAGAQSTYILGVRSGIAIRNVECIYTVRVDVLASSGYYLVSGDPPTMTTATEIAPPPPPLFDFSWLGEIFQNPFIVVIVVLVLVMFSLIGIKILASYLGFGRRGRGQ